MVSLNQIPVPKTDVIGQRIDQELVLVLTDKAQVKVINESGAFIWQQVDGSRSIREIAELVSQEYEIDIAQAEEDVLSFIIELADKGVLGLN